MSVMQVDYDTYARCSEGYAIVKLIPDGFTRSLVLGARNDDVSQCV